MFKTKNINFEIKDLDTVGRQVKFAAARFNNMDSDGDVIIKGAFAKSIKERGVESDSNRKIKFLRYHDFQHPIGNIKYIEETNDVLMVTAELGRSTKGNDAFLDYQDGIITEHSIGFEEIQDKIEIRDNARILKELLLWEVSAVTFGANSETPMYQISKGNKVEYLDKLNKKMNNLIVGLKNGKGTDERLLQIEMDLRVCQSKYNEVINSLDVKSVNKPLNIIEPNNHKEFYLGLIK